MTNSRKARIRRQRQRRALLTMALVLVTAFACIGGTIAWLTAETGAVTNTFTVGDINITLDEGDVYELGEAGQTAKNLGQHKDDGTTRVSANKYQVIPGSEYDKDPTVTVKGGSEACYLFVKFEETGDPQTYFNYTSNLTTDNGWTQGTGTIPSDVWYRVVPASTADQPFHLLTDDTIAVKDTVVKTNVQTAAAAQLKWTAYAIQTANMTDAADAWAKLNG